MMAANDHTIAENVRNQEIVAASVGGTTYRDARNSWIP